MRAQARAEQQVLLLLSEQERLAIDNMRSNMRAISEAARAARGGDILGTTQTLLEPPSESEPEAQKKKKQKPRVLRVQWDDGPVGVTSLAPVPKLRIISMS